MLKKNNGQLDMFDHIIIDEDSEIILASVQTPFNTGGGKELIELLEKTETQVGLKPKELSADKAYGETENRAYLKDARIISNIAFYKEANRKNQYLFKISDFIFSKDFNRVTCPNSNSTETYKISYNKATNRDMKTFRFDPKLCAVCPLIRQCIHTLKNGKFQNKGRKLDVFYDMMRCYRIGPERQRRNLPAHIIKGIRWKVDLPLWSETMD